MTKTIVDQEFLDANPGLVAEIGDEVDVADNVNPGAINEVGSSVPGAEDDVPPVPPVYNHTGENEVDTEPLPPAPEVVNEVVNSEASVPGNRHNGKLVIGEETRDREGKIFHVLKLEDGSTYDLTEADYEAYLAANK